MKKTLTLECNGPDDEAEFQAALHGLDYALALSDLDAELRHMSKYDDCHSVDPSTVREMIRRILDERGLSLDELG